MKKSITVLVIVLHIIFMSFTASADSHTLYKEEFDACKSELIKTYSATESEQLLQNIVDIKALSEVAISVKLKGHSCLLIYNASGDLEGALIQ